MTAYPHQHLLGAVYILENTKAQRVKVGMTINNPDVRLMDVNDKWLGLKATCQICSARRIVMGDKKFPKHGHFCEGGNALPLEKDATLAKSHLAHMRRLRASGDGSVTRQINNLEKKIRLYQHYQQPLAMWQLNTTFYTEYAAHVELRAHEVLADHLDKLAPIGEVFSCSVAEASEAIESVLSELGLLEAARKEVRNDNTSKEYANCSMCGENLTGRGACLECSRPFFE
jgi:hypothetical protein